MGETPAVAGWQLATIASVGVMQNRDAAGCEHALNFLKIGRLIARRHVYEYIEGPHSVDRAILDIRQIAPGREDAPDACIAAEPIPAQLKRPLTYIYEYQARSARRESLRPTSGARPDLQHLDLWLATYFAVTTGATIGAGDVTPLPMGRCLPWRCRDHALCQPANPNASQSAQHPVVIDIDGKGSASLRPRISRWWSRASSGAVRTRSRSTAKRSQSRQINLGPLGLAWASATFEYGAEVDRARHTSSGGASPLTWSSAGHKRDWRLAGATPRHPATSTRREAAQTGSR
jgi:hypothetical protein